MTVDLNIPPHFIFHIITTWMSSWNIMSSWKLMLCQGTFSFKGYNMLFFSFVCPFSRIYYCLSVPGKQEWAELHTVLRTEIMRKGTCLDSPSVTPLQWFLSLTLLKCNLFSYAPLTQDMESFLALWRLLFAWLRFCSVLFFNYQKLPCMKIYKHAFLQIKHPCFTRDLGPLHPSSCWLQSPSPSLQRPWLLRD